MKSSPIHRCFAVALCIVLAFTSAVFSGCSSVPLSKPQSPTVSVAGVRPMSLSFTNQELEFKLRVQNPNSFDLPMESLNFSARFAGEQFAKGESNEKVTVPANGEAIVSVVVKTGIGKVMKQLESMLQSQELNLDYDVTGVVKLANWPKAIPFNVEGELEDPLQPDNKE